MRTKEEALASYLKGKKYFEQGLQDEGMKELIGAGKFFKHLSENSVLADIHRLLGEIFYNKGNYIESRNHYKKAYFFFKKYNHKIGMADCYDQIALSFMIQNELGYAEEYQIKAIKIREETPDKKGMARGLKNLAVITYKKDNNYIKALTFLKDAQELSLKSKDAQLIINIALDRAKILTKIEEYEEAMKSYVIARRFSKDYSINLPDEHDDDFGDLLLSLGLKKFDSGDLEEALKYLNAVLAFKAKNKPLIDSIEQTIFKIKEVLERRKRD